MNFHFICSSWISVWPPENSRQHFITFFCKPLRTDHKVSDESISVAYHLHVKKTNNCAEFVLCTRETRDNGVRPKWASNANQTSDRVGLPLVGKGTSYGTQECYWLRENTFFIGTGSVETPYIWCMRRIREKNNVFMFKTHFTLFTLDKLML